MTVERAEREGYILDLLAKEGELSVVVLAKDLEVSEVTVRASLKSMEERGLLSRTWGGAKASAPGDPERAGVGDDVRDRIAAAAAELVLDGDRIMIEAGLTSARIAEHLTGRQGVEIITNSVLAFNYARANPDLRVVLTGGLFNRQSESFVGTVAWKAIRGFKARLAFVGADGFTPARGLTTDFGGGAEVIATMSARSEETWLVADSTKYGKASSLSVLSLDRLAGIITDKGIPKEALEGLEQLVPSVLAV